MLKEVKMLQIGIHTKKEKGDVITLINRHGLRIKWNGREFVIPRYFESGSWFLPRLIWLLITPKAFRAILAYKYIRHTWTKAESDKMFFDLMVEDGVCKILAWLTYKWVEKKQ